MTIFNKTVQLGTLHSLRRRQCARNAPTILKSKNDSASRSIPPVLPKTSGPTMVGLSYAAEQKRPSAHRSSGYCSDTNRGSLEDLVLPNITKIPETPWVAVKAFLVEF